MAHARASRAARWFGAASLLLLVLGGVLLPGAGAEEAILERVPGDVKIHGSPDGIDPYVIVEAFPNLRFERPIWIGHPPGSTKQLWVMEQGGRILTFENNRTAKKARVALDLRKQVLRSHNEEGLQALAFAPDFKKSKRVYVTYSAGDPRRLVLSRFVTSGSRKRIMPRSEEVLLRQAQPYGNHNGGGLAFGPDGMLYLSIGDGGSHGDPRDNAQDLMNWFGTILRLDVSPKKGYEVPKDNPFVRIKHARKEIWAFGLQNPRRFSFDPVTDQLWAGDVGNDKFQEINRIEKGGNYGWSLREGTSSFKKGHTLVPPTDPVLTLGTDVARRITGGVIYRGSRMPALNGAYVFGDVANGNVWAARLDEEGGPKYELIGRGRPVTSFGTDAEGELFFTCFDGRVYTLAPWTGHRPKGRFPRRLSETGLFPDMATLEPHAALLPYEINVPLWSDGAHKTRYVMLPGMERIQVAKDGRFTYPVGTIFVKHFHFDADDTIPAAGKRLETRLFVKGARRWEGYTYVWDEAQTEAHLLDGQLEQVRQDPHGKSVGASWTFPSRSDCMSCHTEVGGWIVGFRPEQLNRAIGEGDEAYNQLERFRELGFFEGDLDSFERAWPDWREPGTREREAVRAYLDVNCATCHQPNGPGNASIDLRFDTPIKESGLVDKRPGQWNLGLFDARLIAPGEPARSLLHVRLKRTDEKGMPPLAHNVPHADALERIAAWIKTIKKK